MKLVLAQCLAALIALGSYPSLLSAVELVSGVSDPAFLGSTANGASDGVGLAASRARTVFDNMRVWEDSALTR